MMVVISYDISLEDTAGARRLRRISDACKDFGQRVQYSVFECILDPAQWVALKERLKEEMNTEKDSIRVYYLGSNWRRRIEHIGAKEAMDQEGPLVF